ncbi:hypothetical protein OESDEN_05675 [Oesophagostomum dentatum]|uniref:Transcription factor IIA, alpha/beta subunit n=1 Tax=Oesophagostomum dentatum TaxID=61180 RepID=A0A0B1TE47_OESDE|nr:hypothetical protein OESDEN_05675 [Oesophagostomum dentatum]
MKKMFRQMKMTTLYVVSLIELVTDKLKTASRRRKCDIKMIFVICVLQVVEEDPLNSGDDQSDDEDLETLFDADNVIMCQFEKVHRARSKWKFQLKDGIMHIDNKDYCFQKCSGEAEW